MTRDDSLVISSSIIYVTVSLQISGRNVQPTVLKGLIAPQALMPELQGSRWTTIDA